MQTEPASVRWRTDNLRPVANTATQNLLIAHWEIPLNQEFSDSVGCQSFTKEVQQI
jgi:hypothetical protein